MFFSMPEGKTGRTLRLARAVTRLLVSRHAAVILAAAAIVSVFVTYGVLTGNSTDINTVFWLLNLDLALLLLLGAVVARHAVRLWGEKQRGIAGSRLHVRLVFVFSLLAAAPAILMAIFSSIFFYFGVHAWFSDRVSTAVNESLEVAQAYLREHQQVMRADVLAMANDLNREAFGLLEEPEFFEQMMQTQSRLRNLPEAIVVSSDGTVIASAPLSLSLELEPVTGDMTMRAAGGEVLLMTGNSHDRIRALVKLDRFLDAYLYVGRIVDASVLGHMRTAEAAVEEYTALQGRSSQLQFSITAMFMTVALLLLLAAVWLGLRFAQQLAIPISALITAAERVRMGDLTARVNTQAANDDELSLLGNAFNRMTDQIQGQQAELLRANTKLSERRRFTEAVLSGASSGVIGLGVDGEVTLANARAGELLLGEKRDKTLLGQRLSTFIPEVDALIRLENPPPLETEYAVADGPRRTLMIRVTGERGGEGLVATIDDISALVSAQRKAAWSDVARRIAHEIKNPLTPIQLSAERLRRKYLPQIKDDPETFEKCTETIIRQVADIGHMVNEFSSYARMPLPVKRRENLVAVCQDSLVLQRQAHPDIGFVFVARDTAIEANIDRAQVAQVITNLLQNAIDSIHDRKKDTRIEGEIKMMVDVRGNNITLVVEDNGTGLPERIQEHIMEPYVTTKKKGSGLGLAIVKKIMEDHGGSVVLENNIREGIKLGAKAVIILPRDLQA